MNIHVIELTGYCAKSPDWPAVYLGTAGSYGNESFAVTLGEGWEGLTVTATFQPAGVTALVPDGGVLDVPWEATETALDVKTGRIVFEGVTDGRVLISADIPYTVGSHSDTEGSNSQPPTPSEWEQFVSEVKGDANRAEQAAKDAEASVQAAKDAGAQQAENIAQAGSQQVQAVQAAGTAAVGTVNDARDEAVEKIETANAHAPQINPTTGYWQTWDAETGQYVDTTTKAQGPQGSKGDTGNPGPQGETGATPQLTIGTVTTLEPGEDATANITGTEEAPVLNFGIPKGEPGEGSTGGSDLPATTAADRGKAPTVNAAGTGYELTGPYAPLSAAIIETAKGNPAVCENSVEWPLQGMRVYGKSTQVTTTGAQLFDISSIEVGKNYSSTGILDNYPSRISTPLINLPEGTTQVSSSSSSELFLILVEFGEDGALLNRRTSLPVTGTQTLNENTKVVGITFFRNYNVEVIESEIADFMLNAGSTALPYEPYTGGKPSPSPEYPQEIHSAGDDGEISITLSDGANQSQALAFSTPNGLPGIPVDSGGNFVDTTGQEWICNYRDWARGVDVKCVNTISFDGSSDENMDYAPNIGFQTEPTFYLLLPRNFIEFTANAKTLSNQYIFQPVISSKLHLKNGHFFTGSTYFGNRIACRNDAIKSVNEMRSFLAQNPLTFVVKAYSPIETPIPDTDIAAYRALHTYDGTTVITPDDELTEVEVDYIVKPKAYIEKKLTAIEQKIQEVAAAQIDTQTGG